MTFVRLRAALLSGSGVCTLLCASPAAALAQSATPLPDVPVETQGQGDMPFAPATLSGAALAAKTLTTDDTAALLSDIPGVSLNAAGGISSLPSIHGLSDDRLLTLVDGVPVTSSCPNHMNPPLSYIAPGSVGQATVMAGITPVSAGGDSIGGTITVDRRSPVFAKPGEGIHSEALLSTSFRSVDSGLTSSVRTIAASDTVSLGLDLSRAHALDYHDGDGNAVHGTRYETYAGTGTAALRGIDDQLVVRGGVDYTPYEGFPNQPMDMTFNRGIHVDGRYTRDFDWGSLDATLYWRDVRHEMNFLFGWQNGPVGSGMPMLSHGQDLGYSVKAEIPLTVRDTLRLGNEFHRYTLDDWWPATMGMVSAMGPGTFQNIADGQRNVLGTYAEWQKTWTPRWTSLVGLRNDTVLMDAGNIQGYNSSSMAGQYYGTDAAAFNALDHRRLDVNLDATALARYQASDTNTDEFGYARKTRSPNLYERYAWSSGSMAANMIGWFGDYNGYVGNVSLQPEVANTLSATAGWHDAARKDWDVNVTPYYTYVQNYIGVDRISSLNGHSLVSGGTPYSVLQFANHDSELFGFDLSGRKALARGTPYGDFDVGGTVGWVRGMQVNDGENLYHLMPINGKVTVEQKLGGWSNAVDVQAVGGKDLVETIRNEPITPAYALVNLRSAYQWQRVTISVGIENLFNKQYYDPLGGVDFKDFRYDEPRSTFPTPYAALPGMGRSFDAGVTIKF